MISLLIERMESSSDSIALVYNKQYYSYHDLLKLSYETKIKFEKFGVSKGSAVVILGDFSINSIAAMIACFMVKATVIPITEGAYVKLKQQIDLMNPDVFVNALKPSLIISEYVSKLNLNDAWRQLLPKNEPGLIVFTSGSTGTPKAIMHSIVALCYRYVEEKPPLTAMCFLKFDHMGGVNTILSILFRGGKAVIPSKLNAETICREIEKYQVSLLPSTPSFLTHLVISESIRNHALGCLKVVSYGTEVMSENILLRLNKELPHCKFKQTYGLSETGVFKIKSKSNKCLWFKFIDQGLIYKVESDVLWIKTKSNLLGKILFEDGKINIERQKEEWFCTNDVVEVSGEYLRIKSRTTDIINVGGLKVFPVEVENCILELEYVRDVTVVAVKNLLIGEMITAHISIKDDACAKETERKIRKHCKDRLEKYMVPSKFIFNNNSFINDRFKKVRC